MLWYCSFVFQGMQHSETHLFLHPASMQLYAPDSRCNSWQTAQCYDCSRTQGSTIPIAVPYGLLGWPLKMKSRTQQKHAFELQVHSIFPLLHHQNWIDFTQITASGLEMPSSLTVTVLNIPDFINQLIGKYWFQWTEIWIACQNHPHCLWSSNTHTRFVEWRNVLIRPKYRCVNTDGKSRLKQHKLSSSPSRHQRTKNESISG